MSVNYKEFGKNKDNNNIVLITLTNENGYAMGVTNLGASLVSFCAKINPAVSGMLCLDLNQVNITNIIILMQWEVQSDVMPTG